MATVVLWVFNFVDEVSYKQFYKPFTFITDDDTGKLDEAFVPGKTFLSFYLSLIFEGNGINILSGALNLIGNFKL